ncbi:MAG: ribonuclease III [Desulfarculaceae bacterium]|jgi:ribonuclease III
MDQARIEALEALAAKLQYVFEDLNLLDGALRHSSYVHEQALEELESNERIEFLGDAVLELGISQLLYSRFPHAQEGQLSKARAAMVNESRLAQWAQSLDLGAYLLLGRGEDKQKGREKTSILADAMEAVVAAVFLDGGLAASDEFIQRHLGSWAEEAMRRAARKDFKTRFQEQVQEKLHLTPDYELRQAIGPDHDKDFVVALCVKGKELAQGRGKSKKEAEQMAAKKALDLLESGDLNL